MIMVVNLRIVQLVAAESLHLDCGLDYQHQWKNAILRNNNLAIADQSLINTILSLMRYSRPIALLCMKLCHIQMFWYMPYKYKEAETTIDPFY